MLFVTKTCAFWHQCFSLFDVCPTFCTGTLSWTWTLWGRASTFRPVIKSCITPVNQYAISVLAEMLSRFFIWIFLGFLLNKSGVICESPVATLTARWHQRWHSLLLQRLVSLRTKFTFMERPPQNICARLHRPVNALQLCCWQFSHKVDFYTKIGCFAFLPLFGGLDRQHTMFSLGLLESAQWTSY